MELLRIYGRSCEILKTLSCHRDLNLRSLAFHAEPIPQSYFLMLFSSFPIIDSGCTVRTSTVLLTLQLKSAKSASECKFTVFFLLNIVNRQYLFMILKPCIKKIFNLTKKFSST